MDPIGPPGSIEKYHAIYRESSTILRRDNNNTTKQRKKYSTLHFDLEEHSKKDYSSRTPLRTLRKRFRYRPYLDGLRGYAVLIVVLFHTGVGIFREGFLGVDIFFVLSGYLITSIIILEYDNIGTIDLFRFYARRARRILPGASVTLIIVAMLYRLVDFENFIDNQKCIMAAATYWANQCFILRSYDYWADTFDRNPIHHYWSLSIEEQYYFIYPFLLLVTMFMSTQFMNIFEKLSISKFTSKRRVVKIVMIYILSIISLFSLLYSIKLSFSSSLTDCHMSSFGRVYQLGSGGILALVQVFLEESKWRPDREIWKKHLRLASSVTLVFIFSFNIFLGRIVNNLHPSYSGFLMTFLVSTLIFCIEHGNNKRRSIVLSNKLLIYFGKWSYSIYLWHFPLITLGDKFFVFPSLYDSSHFWISLRVVLICLCSFITGILSYYLVERRFMRIKIDRVQRKLKMSSLVILIPLASTILILILSFVRDVNHDGLLFSSDNNSTAYNIPSVYSLEEEEEEDKDVFVGTRVLTFGDSHMSMQGLMWKYISQTFNIPVHGEFYGGYMPLLYQGGPIHILPFPN